MPARSIARRDFCAGAVAVACLSACQSDAGDSGDSARPASVDGVPPCTTLAPSSFAALVALFDALVPGPGGAADAGAAWYLDQLLGAFSVDPPRIYAGGPYSGRHGGRDGFSHFQRLTRVEEIRWRIALEGSKGLPEREFAGPVIGLADRYADGLAALDAAARAAHNDGFAALSAVDRATLLAAFDAEFVTMAYRHAVEGTYGDPAYGGNADEVGWETIDFEGDRQPLGYTAAQMAEPEDG